MRLRQAFNGSLVFVCYLLWTGVLIGIGSSGGLWLIGRFYGDGSETSSAYEAISDNAQWLLVGSAVLALPALALSWWTDRHAD